jgi:hypothetical protein
MVEIVLEVSHKRRMRSNTRSRNPLQCTILHEKLVEDFGYV